MGGKDGASQLWTRAILVVLIVGLIWLGGGSPSSMVFLQPGEAMTYTVSHTEAGGAYVFAFEDLLGLWQGGLSS